MNIVLISKSFLIYNTLNYLLNKYIDNSNTIIISDKNEFNNINYSDIDVTIIDMGSNIIEKDIILQIIKFKDKNKIIALDLKGNVNDFIDFVLSGIDGYITEVDIDEEFIFRIKRILRGKKFYDYHMTKQALSMNDVSSFFLLTIREKQVLQLICKGLSNEEIGSNLHISKHTVKRYVSSIYNKLNIKNRKELMVSVQGYNN